MRSRVRSEIVIVMSYLTKNRKKSREQEGEEINDDRGAMGANGDDEDGGRMKRRSALEERFDRGTRANNNR